jgi:hypothetical protein
MKILSTLILVFLPALLGAQETPRSVECSSIEFILANPQACDKQPVRLAGKVIQFRIHTSKDGKPYTEFTLAEGSKTLRFFSYDHLPLDHEVCVRVEGIYHTQRQVGQYTFENQVVVEKRAGGITRIPCPTEKQAKEKLKVEKAPAVSPSVVEKTEEKRKAPSTSSPAELSWSAIVNVAVLMLILLGVAVLRSSRYYRWGRAFEEYVIGLFPESEWEIEDRSSDTSKRIGRRVTGDVSYDCIMKHRRTSKRFIVQCKYRSRFFRQDGQEGIEWAKPYQIRNYRDFQRTKGWPYLVIIGVGGRPRKPQHLFVFRLDQVASPFVRKIDLQAAKRDQPTFFTVTDQGLLA